MHALRQPVHAPRIGIPQKNQALAFRPDPATLNNTEDFDPQKMPRPTMPLTKNRAAIDMLKTGRFSDFKIICEDFEFKLHRNILYPASEFFSTLLDSPFSESFSKECTMQETSCLAMGALILYIYTGFHPLDDVYDIWPALFKDMDHFCLEYPNDDDTWNMNKAYETSLRGSKADSMLRVQTLIRLAELADRLLFPKLSESLAHMLMTRMWVNFERPHEMPNTIESFADNARILLDVYRYTEPKQKLRGQCMATCLRYQTAIENAIGDNALVMRVIQAHPEINNDWEIGKQLKIAMQASHDEHNNSCAWKFKYDG